jgi:hypothetical protein
MDRVMEHAGVDAGLAARADRGIAFYEARTNCIACRHERACRAWLARAADDTLPPAFCPNAEFFRSCRGVRQNQGMHDLRLIA